MIRYFIESLLPCTLDSRSSRIRVISRSFLTYPSSSTRSYSTFWSNRFHHRHRTSCTTEQLRVAPDILIVVEPRLNALLVPFRASPQHLLPNSIGLSTLSVSSHLHRLRSLSNCPVAYLGSLSPRRLHPSFTPLLQTSTTSIPHNNQLITTHDMAENVPDGSSGSSLSPPPEHLVASTKTSAAVQPAVNDRKRKAETTPRNKRASAQLADVVGSAAVTGESPRPKRRASKKIKVDELSDDEPVAAESTGTSRRAVSGRNKKSASQVAPTKKKVIGEEVVENEFGVQVKAAENGNGQGVTKAMIQAKSKAKDDDISDDDHEEKTKKTPKPKSKPQKILPPLAERTQDSKLRIGAHVSIAGGIHNSILNVVHIGANAFAMFMKNQRKWETIEMDPEHAAFFIQWCKDHSINAAECCLPHGSYLVNLAHPDPARKKQAYDSFLNDLTRCHKLGIRLYNFHPGNANATTREEGIKLIAENLNEAHADPATGNVVTVLETMATLGNTIGGTFEDLAAIIELVNDKSRVGVCLDTCHVFAAGYDLRTPEAYAKTMEEFDEVIGLQYLKAFHINDSKAPLSSNRDLHARIGTGFLGLQAFHNLMNDERFHGLPMVLETPIDVIGEGGKKTEDKGVWAREIKLLESLVGMSVDSDNFKTQNTKLQEEGTSERQRVGDQVQRKAAKDTKPKKKRPSKKKVESEDEDDLE
ncbi:AP endonuclease [Decorospora gaudefroyi]|uniref:Apurinic-apyrimidinic endonuclease 1 n=1 Tax=Decorospora gaudefroyi TaxID=184978 RepID=A0A6A5KB64_9PLEO|nr:AP endonuclease [Decorospora gaudefroyi]